MRIVHRDQLPAGSYSHELVGEALFVAGEEHRTVGAGEILIVPPGMPHRFENRGEGVFREIGIHVSPRFATEWLEG